MVEYLLQYIVQNSVHYLVQVLSVAAHPTVEHLAVSSDSLGRLHAWQYSPIAV